MGIEDEIKIIQEQLSRIADLIQALHKDLIQALKEKENVSDKKDKNTKEPETKQEIDSDKPIFYECQECGVNFTRGEEHVCKTSKKDDQV